MEISSQKSCDWHGEDESNGADEGLDYFGGEEFVIDDVCEGF